MNILSSEFKQYVKSVYPNPVPSDQSLQLQQAFYAGAVTIMTFMSAHEGSDDEIAQQVKEMIKEVESLAVCGVHNHKARN